MCKLSEVFHNPLLFSVVLLSQMSYLNREAGWPGGVKRLEKIVCTV